MNTCVWVRTEPRNPRSVEAKSHRDVGDGRDPADNKSWEMPEFNQQRVGGAC